jgi:hypothetical protein
MTIEEIEELMESKGIAVAFAAADANPFMPGDNDDMRHWFCTLSADGVEAFDFYVSATEGPEMSGARAVAFVMEDVKVYRGCPGYADFLLLMGLGDDDSRADLAVAWSEMGRLTPLVESVFDLDREAAPAAPGMGSR